MKILHLPRLSSAQPPLKTGLRRRTLLHALAGALAPGAALAQATKALALVSEHLLEKREGVAFSRPTEIDNPWLPMKPGMRYNYDGTTVAPDGKLVPHRIVVHVTDLVKVIDGVATVVSYDQDFSQGELVEAELAFYAQDDAGNVWRFGEYPEEYENGRVVAAPAWLAGQEGARAGVMMKAEPAVGAPSYSQGYGPAVAWTDRGQVHQMGQEVAVGGTRYTDVLVIRETSLAEEGAWQVKYYARGIGNIKVGYLGESDTSKETLELTRAEMMTDQELAAVRSRALALERSAYRRSPDLYGRTAPATPRDPAK